MKIALSRDMSLGEGSRSAPHGAPTLGEGVKSALEESVSRRETGERLRSEAWSTTSERRACSCAEFALAQLCAAGQVRCRASAQCRAAGPALPQVAAARDFRRDRELIDEPQTRVLPRQGAAPPSARRARVVVLGRVWPLRGEVALSAGDARPNARPPAGDATLDATPSADDVIPDATPSAVGDAPPHGTFPS